VATYRPTEPWPAGPGRERRRRVGSRRVRQAEVLLRTDQPALIGPCRIVGDTNPAAKRRWLLDAKSLEEGEALPIESPARNGVVDLAPPRPREERSSIQGRNGGQEGCMRVPLTAGDRTVARRVPAVVSELTRIEHRWRRWVVRRAPPAGRDPALGPCVFFTRRRGRRGPTALRRRGSGRRQRTGACRPRRAGVDRRFGSDAAVAGGAAGATSGFHVPAPDWPGDRTARSQARSLVLALFGRVTTADPGLVPRAGRPRGGPSSYTA
jgi:hypothetical protein